MVQLGSRRFQLIRDLDRRPGVEAKPPDRIPAAEHLQLRLLRVPGTIAREQHAVGECLQRRLFIQRAQGQHERALLCRLRRQRRLPQRWQQARVGREEHRMIRQAQQRILAGLDHCYARPFYSFPERGRKLPHAAFCRQSQPAQPASGEQLQAEGQCRFAQRRVGPGEIDLPYGEARPIQQQDAGQLVSLPQATERSRCQEPAGFRAGRCLDPLRAHLQPECLAPHAPRRLLERAALCLEASEPQRRGLRALASGCLQAGKQLLEFLAQRLDHRGRRARRYGQRRRISQHEVLASAADAPRGRQQNDGHRVAPSGRRQAPATGFPRQRKLSV